MEVDEALAHVGGYRRFHIFAFISVSFSICLSLAAQYLGIVFAGFKWPHHCTVPEGAFLNETLPPGRDGTGYSQCSMYVNSTVSNVTTQCTDGWTHEPTGGEYTIVMEWDLVCDKNYMAELSQTLYQAGAMIGELIASILVDLYGRKWVHITTYIGIGVLGTGLAFTKSYLAFVTIRPLIAIFVSANVLAGLTQMMELFDSEKRTFAGIGLEFLWSVAYMYVGLLAYYIRDWHMLFLALSLSSFIGLINVIIPESPLWLVANNREKEAEEALQKMARYNGVKVTGPLLDLEGTKPSMEKKILLDAKRERSDSTVSTASIQNKPTHKETVIDLFRDPLLRKYLFVSTLYWFTNNIVYYFLILSAPAMGGDLYLSFFLGGVIEVPAFALAFVIVRYGRRWSTFASHILAGVGLATLVFIPSTTASGVDLVPLRITVYLLGKFGITISFSIIVLYTRELFPTNLRGTGQGFANVLGRIGNMAAPFMTLAVHRFMWMPNVILAILCLVVALLTLLLPETKDWPLPQSIADVHMYARGGHRERKNTLLSARLNSENNNKDSTM